MSERQHHAPASIPFQSEMESRLNALIITFDDKGVIKPGGMCGCCGGGPIVHPEWRGDPWYIYRAGLCDSDGVYYAMLCEGCLKELRFENSKRSQNERDEVAREITDLLGNDLDGAQAMMDELGN